MRTAGDGASLVRRGRGGRRREVGMDARGWDELQLWRELRVELPVGPLRSTLLLERSESDERRPGLTRAG
jgi:hypothetical protein